MVNHLQLILGKHMLDSVGDDRESDSTSNDRRHCDLCHGIDHWQPHGSTQWYCVTCDPPPTQSMIAHRAGAPTIVQSVAYAIGQHGTHSMSFGGNRIEFAAFNTRPICKCGSHMVVEHTWSDGLATFECASCGASLPTA